MQQEQKTPSDKFDITSPTFSKSVTFCFNFDQDHPLQLISWEEDKGRFYLKTSISSPTFLYRLYSEPIG